MRLIRLSLVFMLCSLSVAAPGFVRGEDPPETRRSKSEAELSGWLRNMLTYHRFSLDEIRTVTGLSETEIRSATAPLDPGDFRQWDRTIAKNSPIEILPYPGGRHPRIGFLEGAIDPQRETKFSAFTPWDPESYVVIDLPEAIWSNLGLTYLAHTHVPTIWTEQGIALERLEWNVAKAQSLTLKRQLPNGISFETWAIPAKDGVRMGMSLRNGTDKMLTDLRVQMCSMLKGAKGFAQQTNDNKLFVPPFAAVHDESGKRWIITGWEPSNRVWGNSKCPCLHSDPKFPDCPPGETRQLHGWISFYEGTDIYGELSRLYQKGW